MSIPGWEHFYHEADIGLRGFGKTRAEAFEQVALAMTAVVTTLDSVRPAQRVEITAAAQDDELLLVEWLNTLIYEMSAGGMLFSRFEVQLDDNLLHGRAWGEPVDRERHQPAVEVKGATLTGLGVARDAEGIWQAQCVVDV
ncbi:MAG: archease [Chromatiales bacterium]|jgi:tRNA nucleotidyltransferase (CCA-adding enzyme)